MNVRLGFFVLTLFCLPMSAFSAVINIEYSGHIYSTSGDGFGYSLGDLISGTAIIDTSKAEGDHASNPSELWAYGKASGDLVRTSNYVGGDVGEAVNFVRVYDGLSTTYDYLDLQEVLSIQGSLLSSFGISFHFDGLDWITYPSGTDINFVTSDATLLSQSYGSFAQFDMTNWTITSIAQFQVDSVKIISANVPEPTPFILLSVGLLGILLRKKIS